MKFTDDYSAKIKIWAAERKVHPLPKATGFPYFGWKKFHTCEEFTNWKRDYLKEIARQGGLKWMK